MYRASVLSMMDDACSSWNTSSSMFMSLDRSSDPSCPTILDMDPLSTALLNLASPSMPAVYRIEFWRMTWISLISGPQFFFLFSDVTLRCDSSSRFNNSSTLPTNSLSTFFTKSMSASISPFMVLEDFTSGTGVPSPSTLYACRSDLSSSALAGMPISFLGPFSGI